MKGFSDYVKRGAAPPYALVGLKATSDGVSKLVTLGIAIVSARTLSSEEFGVLALAMVTGWLLGVASDAGLPMLLAGRMARRAGCGRPPAFWPIADVMRLRARLGGAALLVGGAAALLLPPRSLSAPFWLIVASQVLGAMLDTLAHAYRGMGRADVDARVTLLARFTSGLVALGTLAVVPTLAALSVALAVPAALSLAASLVVAGRLTVGDEPASDRDGDRPLALRSPIFVREALPVGLAVLISAVYFRSDVFFVERWHGVEVAGVYNAAFRLVEALRLIPAAMLAVAFPALCNAAGWETLRRLLVPLTSSALVVALAVAAGAGPILDLIYGARFVDAAPALRVLAVAIPLLFVNYALTHQVIAWNLQRRYLAVSGAALAANVAGNLLLIPPLGMTGAAISTLTTEVVVTAGCVFALGHRPVAAVAARLPADPLAHGNGGRP